MNLKVKTRNQGYPFELIKI